MEKKYTTCQNCEENFESDFQFCPHCGQKSKDELTLGILFYNTISNYFSFDARFFKSFIPLMLKPGYLAKRFLEGKRLLYLHPAQMYLFISVVFFFLFSFVVRKQTDSVDKALKQEFIQSKGVDSLKANALDSLTIEKFLKPISENKNKLGLSEQEGKALDSLIKSTAAKNKKGILDFEFNEKKIDSLISIEATDKELYKAMGLSEDAGGFERRLYTQALKFYKNRKGGSILQLFYDSIPIAMFILLPIFAFILKLLHYRKGSFSHHLVFSFYFFSYLFIVFSLLLLCNFIWDDFPIWIIVLVILSTFIYLFLAIKRFYEQGWFFSLFKSAVATFLFLIFVLPFAASIVGFMAFLFY